MSALVGVAQPGAAIFERLGAGTITLASVAQTVITCNRYI